MSLVVLSEFPKIGGENPSKEAVARGRTWDESVRRKPRNLL